MAALVLTVIAIPFVTNHLVCRLSAPANNVRVVRSKRNDVMQRSRTKLQPLGMSERYQPQGAFHLLLDVSGVEPTNVVFGTKGDMKMWDDLQLCVNLLQQQQVLVLVPGSAFGSTPVTMCISDVTSLDILVEAVNKLRDYA